MLSGALHAAELFTARDEFDRPVLRCIRVDGRSDGVVVEAADGYKAIQITIPGDHGTGSALLEAQPLLAALTAAIGALGPCTEQPWKPPSHPTRKAINAELIIDEERASLRIGDGRVYPVDTFRPGTAHEHERHLSFPNLDRHMLNATGAATGHVATWDPMHMEAVTRAAHVLDATRIRHWMHGTGSAMRFEFGCGPDMGPGTHVRALVMPVAE